MERVELVEGDAELACERATDRRLPAALAPTTAMR
jgi:hypothetical protein